ncbi:DUF1127 domain-containing protein [Bosea caraganae]|uniref:DUF1127 domain-containing protein n=1 Tax=Bosea caraganae TaxID=2763117 RepID=A0A370KXH7_9HYPH|nr:DUF1127 domain-containing protein [Bosea caraganae]RDJ19670.1 DUF1127 domain-containing protein [Bosea caraganae]RDJ23815.1 DUF1127 domain-containing protein [Bosea caraganae]
MTYQLHQNLTVPGRRPRVRYGALPGAAAKSEPMFPARMSTRLAALRARFAALFQALRQRSTIAHLTALSDEQLRDIGLTRAELRSATARHSGAVEELSRCRDRHIEAMR